MTKSVMMQIKQTEMVVVLLVKLNSVEMVLHQFHLVNNVICDQVMEQYDEYVIVHVKYLHKNNAGNCVWIMVMEPANNQFSY